MSRSTLAIGLTAAVLSGLGFPAGSAHSQAGTPAAAVTAGPAVNDAAPDFALTGATRYGILKAPVRLSDFRGRTVVLAFFYQARTKG
ncbi:MAG TPA: hypothetical protein VFS56_00645 [Gemmatimonadaceae bacterium]|nr:hypothetical protein [Gemmatimonadaceae bacterium]